MNNDIDFERYKNHPRIVEVRFILLFDMFEREYGYQNALKFYEALSNSFYCDMTKLMGLINRRFDIKRIAKSKQKRWRQEVIFTAACFGETQYKVAKDYLIMKASNLYGQAGIYDINTFATDEWLRELDDEIALCGMPAYRNEVNRFFEVVDNLANVLVRWRG